VIPGSPRQKPAGLHACDVYEDQKKGSRFSSTRGAGAIWMRCLTPAANKNTCMEKKRVRDEKQDSSQEVHKVKKRFRAC